MTYKAFDTIAGCSLGTKSPRYVAFELIDETLCKVADQKDALDLVLSLALASDEDTEVIDDIQSEAINLISDLFDLPPFCTIQWEDNEVRVIPYIDDELARFEDIPEGFTGDFCYTVTDHGNVTLWERRGAEYVDVWSMV